MERNQITGLVLILAVIVGYYTFFAPNDSDLAATSPPATTQPGQSDSTQLGQTTVQELVDSLAPPVKKGENLVLENEEIAITINTLGARVTNVLLKNYKTWDGDPINLVDSTQSVASLNIGGIEAVAVPYSVEQSSTNAIQLSGTLPTGEKVVQSFELPAGDDAFVLKHSVNGQNAATALGRGFTLTLADDLRKTERDLKQNRNNSTVNYFTAAGDFDNLGEQNLSLTDRAIAEPLQWVSIKSQFFNWGFIGYDQIKSAALSSSTNENDTNSVKQLAAKLELDPAKAIASTADFNWYFGPNNFHILKNIAPSYEDNVYLGYPVINLVNRYITVNVFHYLESFIGNYGLIIALLVVLLRLVLFPLAYKSYISMAKMRVLKPEIDAIKEKHGEDAAAVQQEQMKLYQQVGINPISGCIPLLLQMPILLAMFNFFPNSVELRQESLWWAHDLSTYDSILDLPFSIPGYGSHVSLFTILMTASTLLVTWYNNQTSSVTGPMVSISYIMPLVFMFVLNSFPAGLNFYYLMSNLVSFGQQVVIRQTVNEDAIRAKLVKRKEENKDKKPSGFAARLEQAMRMAEEQKKVTEQKKKGKK